MKQKIQTKKKLIGRPMVDIHTFIIIHECQPLTKVIVTDTENMQSISSNQDIWFESIRTSKWYAMNMIIHQRPTGRKVFFLRVHNIKKWFKKLKI